MIMKKVLIMKTKILAAFLSLAFFSCAEEDSSFLEGTAIENNKSASGGYTTHLVTYELNVLSDKTLTCQYSYC